MLQHHNWHALPYTTKHEFAVEGIGLIGLYVPAGWEAKTWANHVFHTVDNRPPYLPHAKKVVHVRAIP